MHHYCHYNNTKLFENSLHDLILVSPSQIFCLISRDLEYGKQNLLTSYNGAFKVLPCPFWSLSVSSHDELVKKNDDS